MSNEQIKITTRIKAIEPISITTTVKEGQVGEEIKADVAQLKLDVAELKNSEIKFRQLSEEE